MKELNIRHEKFLEYIFQGYCLTDAYIMAFNCLDQKRSTVATKACLLFQNEELQNRYFELKDIFEKELQQRAIWTKEQAINEIKDVMYQNKREMERYEQAYNDELELIDKHIKELENELNNPTKYLSKKKQKELENNIDNLKVSRINANKRHRQNKDVNSAILDSIEKLNSMLGFDKKQENVQKVQAEINFINDLSEE